MKKSKAQIVAEKVRTEKPNHNDANYISQLERQRGLLLEAIEQDTSEAEKRVWHGPLRSASGWKETEPGKYPWSPDEKIFVDGRCYIVEVPE